MRILRLLAGLRTSQSKWDEAIENCQAAVHIARQLGDLVGEAEALASLIGIFRFRSRFADAHLAFQRVREIHHLLDQQQKSPIAIINMGAVYFTGGEYEKALALFTEALAISRDQQDVASEASCISNIGATYFALGDQEAALNHFQDGIQLHKDIGDRRGKLASFHINIGVIHQSTGNYQKAIDSFTQASVLRQQQGEIGGYATACEYLAGALILIGQLDKAREVTEEALKMAIELDFPRVVSGALENLGLIEFHRGNPRPAMNHYRQALTVAEKASLMHYVAEVQFRIGELLFDSGDHKQCRSHLRLSLNAVSELGETALILSSPIILAALEARAGDIVTGTEKLRNCLRRAEDHGDPRWIILAMRLLGETFISPVSDQNLRAEGYQILQEALSMATAIGLKREIRLIQELMQDNFPRS